MPSVPWREGNDVVVEAGNLDPLLVVMQAGDEAGQPVARIGHGSSENAAVQVAVRPVERDFAG